MKCNLLSHTPEAVSRNFIHIFHVRCSIWIKYAYPFRLPDILAIDGTTLFNENGLILLMGHLTVIICQLTINCVSITRILWASTFSLAHCSCRFFLMI